MFSAVARYSSFRFLIALSVHYGWELQGLDVKTAFLNTSLDEEIYVTQPEGFVKLDFENHVYLLRKAMYGSKESSRQ